MSEKKKIVLRITIYFAVGFALLFVITKQIDRSASIDKFLFKAYDLGEFILKPSAETIRMVVLFFTPRVVELNDLERQKLTKEYNLDFIPDGASPEYAAVLNKAIKECGADSRLIAIWKLWESAVNDIARYRFGKTNKCGSFDIVYSYETGTIDGPEYGLGPSGNPIPLADWNISLKEALRIAGTVNNKDVRPNVLLLNDGDFYWLVDIGDPFVTRFRIDAKTGKILERREFTITM